MAKRLLHGARPCVYHSKNQAGPSTVWTAKQRGLATMAFQFTDSYLQGVYETLCRKNAQEPEFLQAAGEVHPAVQHVLQAQSPLHMCFLLSDEAKVKLKVL